MPQKLSEGNTGYTGYPIDNMRAITCQRVKREHDPELAQLLAGAPRQVEAPRVGTINDVDVVVTRDQGQPPA